MLDTDFRRRLFQVVALLDFMRWGVVVAFQRFKTTYLLLKTQEVQELDSYVAWPLKKGRIDCPETSITDHQTSPRNIPEKRKRHHERSSIL
jgi:hypothetical protein